jgi:hypothetical protein
VNNELFGGAVGDLERVCRLAKIEWWLVTEALDMAWDGARRRTRWAGGVLANGFCEDRNEK